jgi:hypothetical protein
LLTVRAIFDLLFLQPLSAAARRWALVSFPRRRFTAVFFGARRLELVRRFRFRAPFLAAALRAAFFRAFVRAALRAAAL